MVCFQSWKAPPRHFGDTVPSMLGALLSTGPLLEVWRKWDVEEELGGCQSTSAQNIPTPQLPPGQAGAMLQLA